MAQVAFLPPSFVVTVIVAAPADFAVTTPDEDTVATDVLLEDHVMDLSVALEGVTAAVSVCVSPTGIDRDVLFRLTPVTEIFGSMTVTLHVAVFPPSSVLTVIVAVPFAIPFTSPDEDTVATNELLLAQVTFLFVAFSGRMVGFSVAVLPTLSSRFDLSREMLFTLMTSSVTVKEPLSLWKVASTMPSIRSFPMTYHEWFFSGEKSSIDACVEYVLEKPSDTVIDLLNLSSTKRS